MDLSDSSAMIGSTSSNYHLTCPSCRITVSADRTRSMCPFCGNFYDPNIEIDIGLRSNSTLRDDSHQNIFHLPSIDSHRPVLRVTGFGPLITDGLGVIHTYITGLLFRPNTQEETPNLYLSLPPIHNSRRDSEMGETSNISSVRHLANFGLSNSLKAPDFLRRTLEDMEDSHNHRSITNSQISQNYPKRVQSIEEFKKQVKHSTESADYSAIHDFYEQTFSSYVEICALFKLDPEQEGAKSNDPELDFELLYEIYDQIDELPSFISKAVLKGVISSLTSSDELKPKDDIRALFILLQNPIFSNQSSYSVFAHLLKRIVNLNSGEHQLLINWFSNLKAERMKFLVKRVLQFITIREFPPTNRHKLPSISKSRFWIPSATRVLALLS